MLVCKRPISIGLAMAFLYDCLSFIVVHVFLRFVRDCVNTDYFLFEGDQMAESIKGPYALGQFVWEFAPTMARDVQLVDGRRDEYRPPAMVPLTAGHHDELAKLLRARTEIGDAITKPSCWFPQRAVISFGSLLRHVSYSQYSG